MIVSFQSEREITTPEILWLPKNLQHIIMILVAAYDVSNKYSRKQYIHDGN